MAPLADVKILDLSRVLAIPYATQMLSDFGATVWKIEALTGDDTRGWGDHYFSAFNRGKKSVAVDLKNPEGREIVRRLALQADVVVENFKVGDLRRYGLDYETLSAARPELVYLSLTGFGQTGPRRSQLGYDTVMQGMTGIMSLTGEADGPPTKVGVAWIDVMSGLNAVIGVVLALRERERTGRGQYIDLSLFEVGIAALIDVGQGYLDTGKVPARHGSVHRSFAPSQPFECADGGWIMVAVGKETQYERLCRALGRDDLIGDPRFRDNASRVANRRILADELAAVFARESRAHWMAACEAAGVPVSPINDVAETFADPQSLARNVVWPLGEGAAARRLLANPLQHMSGSPPRPQSAPPRLGEHTAEVLSNVLGMEPDRIRKLAETGAIGCDDGPTAS